jgi:hypothetical protein
MHNKKPRIEHSYKYEIYYSLRSKITVGVTDSYFQSERVVDSGCRHDIPLCLTDGRGDLAGLV